jgi:hypothetical protein
VVGCGWSEGGRVGVGVRIVCLDVRFGLEAMRFGFDNVKAMSMLIEVRCGSP